MSKPIQEWHRRAARDILRGEYKNFFNSHIERVAQLIADSEPSGVDVERVWDGLIVICNKAVEAESITITKSALRAAIEKASQSEQGKKK